MSEERILTDEEFVQEAAAELRLLQDRSRALEESRAALDRATKLLEQTQAEVMSELASHRRSLDSVLESTKGVEHTVIAATSSRLDSLAVKTEERFAALAEGLLKNENDRREAFGAGLRGAQRSLQDGAQTLAEASVSIGENVRLVSDFGAREREQWRDSLLQAIQSVAIQLETAAAKAQATTAEMAASSERSLESLKSAAAVMKTEAEKASVNQSKPGNKKSGSWRFLLFLALMAAHLVLTIGALIIILPKLR